MLKDHRSHTKLVLACKFVIFSQNIMLHVIERKGMSKHASLIKQFQFKIYNSKFYRFEKTLNVFKFLHKYLYIGKW